MEFQEIIDFIRAAYKEPEGKIALHEPRFRGKEKEYLIDCIDSTFVSSVGEYVGRFEQAVREYTGSGAAVATGNGTQALHMALLLSGVKRGELVITQPLTFIATCNAIMYTGAEPVFIDVDMQSAGMSPERLQAFLDKQCRRSGDGNTIHIQSGKRIAAVLPMHTFGHPCRADLIAGICADYDLPLIEDAAESMGSFLQGKHTGRFGKFGIFSFNGNKTITCGGGGMIITDDAEAGKMAKHLTTQAKVPHPWNFEHDFVGYNYRLPNLNAALGCAQMEQLENFIVKKREWAMQYQHFFEGSGITFFAEPEHSRSNYWLNAILLSGSTERDEFLKYSNDRGVMTLPAWTLMPRLPMFGQCICDDIPNAEKLSDQIVNLPSSVV